MSSDFSAKIDGWLTVGLCAGLYYFYKGFRVFREYRVLMDTPEIPIRSVAMGLVEIHGKAMGTEPMPSPVTQTPCYFYKVDIEQWVQDKNGGRWSHAATDIDGKRFYVADATGKVLVDAHQAEYDLIQTARVETGGGLSPRWGRMLSGIASPTATAGPNVDLWSYAHSTLVRHKGSGFLSSIGNGGRFRLTEHLVVPDHWYDITGTCCENPNAQDEYDRNLIMKGTNEPTFLITWRSEQEIRRTLRNRAVQYIFGGAVAAVICLGLLLLKHGAF
jgi:hypothetical protein